MPYPPRDYQVKAMQDVQSAFAKGFRAPLLVSPTGSGKTKILSMIAKAIMEKDAATGRQTYIFVVVPKQEIFDQTSKSLLDADLPHGFVKAGKGMNLLERVQLCSAQTLVNRAEGLKQALNGHPVFTFFDEAQHTASPTYSKIMDAFNGWSLGCTATPERLDGAPLTMYDTMVLGPTPFELMSRGVLAKPRYIIPDTESLDLDDVKKVGGDWQKSALEVLMDRPRIVGQAVTHYKRFCIGRPTSCFDASIAAANVSCEAFRAAGYRWAVLDGKMPKNERKEIIRDIGNGQLDGISSCELLIEGTDIPCLSAIIWRRPTASYNIYVQGNGRGVRSAPGKIDCAIVDCVGNVGRHGRIEDPHTWTLEGHSSRGAGKADPADLLPKRCKVCFAIPPSFGLDCCPYCGTPFPHKERKIEIVDGQMVEMENAWGETLSGKRMVPCKECGKPHAEGIDKCPHCGFDYLAAEERAKREEMYARKQAVWKMRTVEELRNYGISQRGMKPSNAAFWAKKIIEARKRKHERA